MCVSVRIVAEEISSITCTTFITYRMQGHPVYFAANILFYFIYQVMGGKPIFSKKGEFFMQVLLFFDAL